MPVPLRGGGTGLARLISNVCRIRRRTGEDYASGSWFGVELEVVCFQRGGYRPGRGIETAEGEMNAHSLG